MECNALATNGSQSLLPNQLLPTQNCDETLLIFPSNATAKMAASFAPGTVSIRQTWGELFQVLSSGESLQHPLLSHRTGYLQCIDAEDTHIGQAAADDTRTKSRAAGPRGG